MNNSIRLMKLAGLDVPSFYGYVKGGNVNVKDEESLTEATFNNIPDDERGFYNDAPAYLIFEHGVLGVVPVKMIMVGNTEAKAPKSVKEPTTMTDMKSSEKSKTDGDPKKTELVTKPDSTAAEGGDPEKTADAVIKDVKSGKRKTDTDGVVKEELEDLEGEEPEDNETEEVKCAECGGTFEGKDVKKVSSCAQHKHMEPLMDPPENYNDEEEEEAVQESAVDVANKIIKAVQDGKRMTDTKEVDVDSNVSSDKPESTLGKALVKDVKIADTKDRDLKAVKEPTTKTDMKSSEKAKTDGDPKKTELVSDTDTSVKTVKIADTKDRDLKAVKVVDTMTDMKSSEKSKTDGDPKSTALKVKEAWDTKMDTPESKKGMFDGKSKEDLESELAKLKKSSPHKEGSAEFTKMKEVEFALRAKNKFGKVEEAASESPPCAKCNQHRDANIHLKQHDYKGYHEYVDPEKKDSKKDVKESAEDIAKKIIAQVKSGHPPHEAENDGDGKTGKNNGFDYNKLVADGDQVENTRKSPEDEAKTQADKTGKPAMKKDKVSVPKKVISQIDQRIKELEEAKKDFDSVDYNGTNGKDNCIDFLKQVKEHLTKGNVEGFQDAQVALTGLSSVITGWLPAALINFLATGRNTVKSDGQKAEGV